MLSAVCDSTQPRRSEVCFEQVRDQFARFATAQTLRLHGGRCGQSIGCRRRAVVRIDSLARACCEFATQFCVHQIALPCADSLPSTAQQSVSALPDCTIGPFVQHHIAVAVVVDGCGHCGQHRRCCGGVRFFEFVRLGPRDLCLLGGSRVVAKGGIEPPTRGFSVRCSTN